MNGIRVLNKYAKLLVLCAENRHFNTKSSVLWQWAGFCGILGQRIFHNFCVPLNRAAFSKVMKSRKQAMSIMSYVTYLLKATPFQ
jgi:hypothetical protein